MIYQIACSDRDGKVQFYLSSNDADSSVIPPESYTRVLDVDCLTLSTICAEKIKKPIRLLKVEAEGYEPEVLSTLNFCHKSIQNITVDAGPERFGKSTKEEVSKILVDNGYLTSYNGDIVFGSKEGCSASLVTIFSVSYIFFLLTSFSRQEESIVTETIKQTKCGNGSKI